MQVSTSCILWLMRDIFRRNIAFAQKVAQFINASPHYELLNFSPHGIEALVPLNIVLFRGSPSSPFSPSDAQASARLTEKINATRDIYVTGTKWRGEGAIRLAVSNWRTGLDNDEFEKVKHILASVMEV